MTERYLIFAGRTLCEVKGGWGDFLSDAPDMNIAQEIVTEYLKRPDVVFHWFQVVDLETKKVVKYLGRRVDGE